MIRLTGSLTSSGSVYLTTRNDTPPDDVLSSHISTTSPRVPMLAYLRPSLIQPKSSARRSFESSSPALSRLCFKTNLNLTSKACDKLKKTTNCYHAVEMIHSKLLCTLFCSPSNSFFSVLMLGIDRTKKAFYSFRQFCHAAL